VKRKYLYAAGVVVAGGVAIWWLRRPSTPAAAPAVAGTLTSGSQSTVIDTNVLSSTFGLPITS
jgi:hypothetical protein